MSEERVLPVNGVDLCVETFGSPRKPTILLLAGMSSSMDWWEDAFCERLADSGRHVVRYDFRDTGRSTSYPVGAPGYTGADLRADCVALLDALGVRRAHLVGISMGGAIAQCIAVERPDKVATLTLVATTAALTGGPDDLPPMEAGLASFLEHADADPAPDPTNVAEVVDRLVEEQRALMRAGFDEARVRAVAHRVVDRSDSVASRANHALLEPGPDPQGTLRDVAAPTLVVHGTADPLFPLPHAEALARGIPGAGLLPLDGVGHEPPPPSTWEVFVPTLLEHTSSDRPQEEGTLTPRRGGGTRPTRPRAPRR